MVNRVSTGPLVQMAVSYTHLFTVTLPVVVSPQFFGWLMGLDGSLTITAPKEAVAAYRRSLTSALELLP